MILVCKQCHHPLYIVCMHVISQSNHRQSALILNASISIACPPHNAAQVLAVTHSSKEHEGEGADPKTELNAILKALQAWGHVEQSNWLSPWQQY